METTRRCKLISSNGFLRVEGFWNVPRGDLEVLGRAMGKKGCLKVGSKESFFPRYFETFLSRNVFIRIFECIIINIIDWRIIIWQLTFRLISFHKNNPLSSRKITRMQHGHFTISTNFLAKATTIGKSWFEKGDTRALQMKKIDCIPIFLETSIIWRMWILKKKKKRIKFKKKKKPRQLHDPIYPNRDTHRLPSWFLPNGGGSLDLINPSRSYLFRNEQPELKRSLPPSNASKRVKLVFSLLPPPLPHPLFENQAGERFARTRK